MFVSENMAEPDSPPPPGWFSFLSMAREELRWPVLATVVAAGAFVFHATRSADRTSPVWFFVVPALACFVATFIGWVRCRRKILALEDAPLSRIGSAPQGYVRLEGRAAVFPGSRQASPLTGQPCCWYAYRVTRERDDRKGVEEVENDTSIWSFALEDGSGVAVLDPEGARLVAVRVRTWMVGQFRYTHSCILPGDPVFVLGEFRTARPDRSEYEVEFAVGQRLAEWKQDMPALLAQYDADRDGRLEGPEWASACAAARREVMADMASGDESPQNRVVAPGDGRAFIISAENRDRVHRDLAIWSWIHLAAFIVGIPVLVHLASLG